MNISNNGNSSNFQFSNNTPGENQSNTNNSSRQDQNLRTQHNFNSLAVNSDVSMSSITDTECFMERFC